MTSHPSPQGLLRGEDLESTLDLIRLAREGDASARERLARRYYETLRGWAHGRLPARARSLADTDDLVQSTIMQALNSVDSFEPRFEGAFLVYMRTILVNQIRDELRRVARRPEVGNLPMSLASPEPSPVEEAIGFETLERYDHALGLLPDQHQQAVILRVEFEMDYRSIADALGMPSANAARMCVTRALVRLAEEMRGPDGTR